MKDQSKIAGMEKAGAVYETTHSNVLEPKSFPTEWTDLIKDVLKETYYKISRYKYIIKNKRYTLCKYLSISNSS